MTTLAHQPQHPASATGGVPIMLAPGDGHAIRPLGLEMCIKAGGGQTAGGLTVIEWAAAPGTTSPPAVHAEDDEAFYVLDGEFTIQVGERKIRATAGAFVYVPRGTLHDVICEGSATGRVLMIFTPGRMDRFFTALAALPPGRPDKTQLLGIAHAFGTQLLPPSR